MKHILKRIVVVILSMHVMLTTLCAKNSTPTVEVSAIKVHFKGTHHITKDDGSALNAGDNTVHYDGDTSKSIPVAYTKAGKAKVRMKCSISLTRKEDDTDSYDIIIWAEGSDGVNLPEQTFSLSEETNEIDYDKESDTNLPDKIRFYGPGIGTFGLKWKYKFNGGTATDFLTSKHRLYLTAGTPGANKQETLYYYACSGPNGNAGTNADTVTDLIWNAFKTKRMKGIDHATGNLTGSYYDYWGTNPSPLGGQCRGWSDFFQAILAVHSYPSHICDLDGFNIIFDDGKTHPGSGWITKGSGKFGSPAINIGQGTTGTPQRQWSFHTILKVGSKYYDPSYGIGGGSKKDYENAGVEWYYYQTSISGLYYYVYQPRNIHSTEKIVYSQ